MLIIGVTIEVGIFRVETNQESNITEISDTRFSQLCN